MQTIDFSSFHILIAEDNIENFDYLRYSLKKTGITIHHAKNGQEAIEIFRSQPKIDLVLMDAMMPLIDGFEATRRIKKIEAEVPVIMLTAYV
ncbi:MAG: response regulator, partial [Bacteroidales bacterium]|nr:response regulator [Bacteroidales bacterium]